MQLNTALKKDFQTKLQLLQQHQYQLFVAVHHQELNQLPQIAIHIKLYLGHLTLEINILKKFFKSTKKIPMMFGLLLQPTRVQ